MVEEIKSYLESQPIIAGAVSLWGLAVLSFFLRNVPLQIWNFISRQATSTMTLTSQDQIYYDFLKWVSDNKFNFSVRNVNAINFSGETRVSIGYGFSFFMFNNVLFRMRRTIDGNNHTKDKKETISLVAFTRNKKVFVSLCSEILDKKYISPKEICVFNNDSWNWARRVVKRRNIDSVILDKGTKEDLIECVKQYLDKKEFYQKAGIPYKLGILLEGPPGTGKTSMILALASLFQRPIYILNLSFISSQGMTYLMSQMEDNSFIIIEDIDGHSFAKKRSEEKEETTSISISELLNALDGIGSIENRILIFTSNHPEKLDPALVRSGRVDYKFHLGYMNERMAEEYLEKFFPKFEMPNNFKIKNKISGSDLQKLILTYSDDVDKILAEISENEN